ncbi:hypothetical protein ACJX0J_033425, partial [Zea mays]
MPEEILLAHSTKYTDRYRYELVEIYKEEGAGKFFFFSFWSLNRLCTREGIHILSLIFVGKKDFFYMNDDRKNDRVAFQEASKEELHGTHESVKMVEKELGLLDDEEEEPEAEREEEEDEDEIE